MTETGSKTDAPGVILRRWLPIIVIGLVMGLGFWQGWYEQLSLSSLIRNRMDLSAFVSDNIFLALIAYMAIYISAVSLSFPGASFITIAGGFMFGWALGGVVTALAATAGASIIFLAAKTSFGESLRAKAGPAINRLADGFKENAFHYLLFLRLTPVFPFWLVNIAPALFDVRLRTYSIATFIGILPGTFAFSFIGAGLDSVIEAQEKANPGCGSAGTCEVDIGALITPELLAAFAGLGILSIIPVVIKKLRLRKTSGQ
ncbi:MAG: TVP38/TMEM64 family protein [Stappiaceae bacterium]